MTNYKDFNIDAHFDLGAIVFDRRKHGQRRVLESFYDSFNRGEFKLIVAAIFVETELTDLSLSLALLQIQALKYDINESENFKLVISKNDMLDLKDTEKIGIILSLEGAEPIGRNISLLDIFYDLGVRGLGLVWSRRNFIGDGSYFGDPEEGIRGGLTPFGINLIGRAEELGFFIDVSHLNDSGFKDVLKYSNKPFIASHSNARSINQISRNLTDNQIKSISDRNGVIGINTYKSIVSKDIKDQNIDKLCDHIEHIIKIGGEDVICIGFDLCTPYYNNGKTYDVIDGHHELYKIKTVLVKRGFTENTLKKIFSTNMYNFLINHLKQ